MRGKLFYTTRDEILTGEAHEIWHVLAPQAFARIRLGRQWFLYVHPDVFKQVSAKFTQEPLRRNHARSKGNVVHLHAVQESPECMNVHVDFLNPSINPLLMVGHFFTDVLPTSLWASCVQRRLVLRPFYRPE